MNRTHFQDPVDVKPMCRTKTHCLCTGRADQVTCKNCLKKMERHFQPIEEAFVIQTRGLLTRLGAKPFPQIQRAGEDQLVLETLAGKLYITPRPHTIFCRFAEPERAGKILGSPGYGRLNQYSGKWNFHFDLGAGLDEIHRFLGELMLFMPRAKEVAHADPHH